jgi:glycosyltransferase AglD
MTFDLCIPTHNESAVIVKTIRTLQAISSAYPEMTWNIIVADNGSTDNTAEAVSSAALKNVKVLRIATPGKGNAIREAAKHSTGDIFGFIDADLSANPTTIPSLISMVCNGTDVAAGSRLLDTHMVKRGLLRTVTSRCFNFYVHLFLQIPIRDTQCGLKVMNGKGKEIILTCRENGWFLDMELLARAKRAGLAVEEVAIEWDEFHYPERKSKLRLVRDGFKAGLAVIRIYMKL